MAVGTAPKQVYIDGVATLDPVKVEESFAHVVAQPRTDVLKDAGEPAIRAVLPAEDRENFCTSSRKAGQAFVITGITKAFLDGFPALSSRIDGELPHENLTLVIDNGEVACLGGDSLCRSAAARLTQDDIVSVQLKNGHLTRGLTAVTSALGMVEIGEAPETGDGKLDIVKSKEAKDPENIDYAKYAVDLGGSQVAAKAFARARLGGVTRAIQAPMTKGGMISGVSTGMRTGLHSTLLNGGLFQEDVAMHVLLGEEAKANEGTVSMAIERLRALVKNGKKTLGETEVGQAESPWALVANGSLPLVIQAIGNVSLFCTRLARRTHTDIRKTA